MNEEKVYVIKGNDDLYNNENGKSFIDTVSVLFKNWKLLIAIIAGVLIIGNIFILGMYNPSKGKYQSTFVYSLSTLEDGKYVDGSAFSYRDLVNYETLDTIKKSNNDFVNIDIDSLFDESDISISKHEDYNTDTKETLVSYTLTVYAKYFNDEEQAGEFIEAIAKYPVTKTSNILTTQTYDAYLKNVDDSTIYDEQVSYLESQYNLLIAKYEKMIEDYGDISLSDGKLISQHMEDMKSYYKIYSFDVLKSEIELNGYIKNNAGYSAQLLVDRANYVREKDLNEKKISAAKQNIVAISSGSVSLQTADIETFNKTVNELTNRNVDIDYYIEVIDRKLNNSTNDNSAFEAKIASYRLKLAEYTNEYIKVEKEVIEDNSNVYYSSSTGSQSMRRLVTKIDSISTVVSVGLTFAIGLVVGCIANAIVHGVKTSKAKNKEEKQIAK